MTRIGRTMKAAGFEWSHVVEAMVYLPDLTKFADMNASYREALVEGLPARATVGAGLMDADGAVEIMFDGGEMIARLQSFRLQISD